MQGERDKLVRGDPVASLVMDGENRTLYYPYFVPTKMPRLSIPIELSRRETSMGLKASISDPGPLDLELNQALGPIEASTPRCDCSALDVAAHRQQQQKGTVLQEGNSVCVFQRECVPGLKEPRSFCVVDRQCWISGALDPNFHTGRWGERR